MALGVSMSISNIGKSISSPIISQIKHDSGENDAYLNVLHFFIIVSIVGFLISMILTFTDYLSNRLLFDPKTKNQV